MRRNRYYIYIYIYRTNVLGGSGYFDGHISDGQKMIRFVRFSQEMHADLTEYQQRRQSIPMKIAISINGQDK